MGVYCCKVLTLHGKGRLDSDKVMTSDVYYTMNPKTIIKIMPESVIANKKTQGINRINKNIQSRDFWSGQIGIDSFVPVRYNYKPWR